MTLELQQALKDDGVIVGLVRLCSWFGIPQRAVYYKPTKGDPKVKAQFVEPICAESGVKRDNWATLALMIDCHTREPLGWHLSRSDRSKTAESALEQARIARYGHLSRVQSPFLLRSDNGLVFTSRSYTALVKSFGLCQEFITPYIPEQNGMVERVIRTFKDQCVYRNRFETLQNASRVIGDRIGFYNHQHHHQALNMRTPAEAYALAA